MSPVLKAWSLNHWMPRSPCSYTAGHHTGMLLQHLVSRSQENHSTSYKAQDSPALQKINDLVYRITSAQVKKLCLGNKFEAFVINTMKPVEDVTELLDFH